MESTSGQGKQSHHHGNTEKTWHAHGNTAKGALRLQQLTTRIGAGGERADKLHAGKVENVCLALQNDHQPAVKRGNASAKGGHEEGKERREKRKIEEKQQTEEEEEEDRRKRRRQ